MTIKHTRLVAAVKEAMQAQNMSQNTLGRVSGVTQGQISAALLDKCELKEEKWRLICEALAIDYDDIVAENANTEPISAPVTAHDPTPAENCGGAETPFSEEPVPVDEDAARANHVLVRYLTGHLKEDVRNGMDIPLEDLYLLLATCRRLLFAEDANSAP